MQNSPVSAFGPPGADFKIVEKGTLPINGWKYSLYEAPDQGDTCQIHAWNDETGEVAIPRQGPRYLLQGWMVSSINNRKDSSVIRCGIPANSHNP